MEEWKPLHNFPSYNGSTEGRIINVRTQHILTPVPDSDGKLRVSLRRNNRQYTVGADRVIAETFLGEHPRMDVRHKDGDLSNIRLDNLYWSSRSDTIREAYARGTKRPYQQIAVRIIETDESYDSIKQCAMELNCDPSYIRQCLRGEREMVKGYHIERV